MVQQDLDLFANNIDILGLFLTSVFSKTNGSRKNVTFGLYYKENLHKWGAGIENFVT
jgi:hypothetical protein